MEEKIKHLEFIQTSICRMNQCSFQVKGWSVTIVTALLAVYATALTGNKSDKEALLIIGNLPTLLFWFLDSYYLQQERKFRKVYNEVAGLSSENEKIDIRMFEMPLGKYRGGKCSYFKVVFSRTVWPLYVFILLFLNGLYFILK